MKPATILEVSDGIARLTLDRPDAANSRNQQMRRELLAHYDTLEADPGVKVLVLTGAGDRFFCAGMDLREASGEESVLQRRSRLRAGRDIERLAALPLPTIAAINGYALGGGLEMALACDLRLMADTAQAGMPEVTHGLIPGGGGTVRLPRLLGPSAAARLIFTGQRIDAAEALRLGLVDEVVPTSELRDHATALATSIAEHPARALRLAKEALLASRELPTGAAVDSEQDRLVMLLAERS